MMIITYSFIGNPSTVDKELTQLQSFNISPIHEMDLLAPIIIFTKSGYNVNANYLYIPEFSRYYFITDTSKAEGNRITLQTSVDVLMSNKDAIMECDLTVLRNENVGTQYFNDDKLPILPGEFSIEGIDMTAIDGFPVGENGGYVLGIL